MKFLVNAKPLILDRVITYVGIIPENRPVPLFILRSMAAAMELGLVRPESREYLAEKVVATDSAETGGEPSGSAHRLSCIEIATDRQTIAGLTNDLSTLFSDEELTSFTDILVHRLETKNDHKKIHYAAVLIRSGLFRNIDSKQFLGILRGISGESLAGFIRESRDELEQELNVTTTPNRESNSAEWIAPHALYGLFNLSDAKLVTDWLRKDGIDGTDL